MRSGFGTARHVWGTTHTWQGQTEGWLLGRQKSNHDVPCSETGVLSHWQYDVVDDISGKEAIRAESP